MKLLWSLAPLLCFAAGCEAPLIQRFEGEGLSVAATRADLEDGKALVEVLEVRALDPARFERVEVSVFDDRDRDGQCDEGELEDSHGMAPLSSSGSLTLRNLKTGSANPHIEVTAWPPGASEPVRVCWPLQTP